MQNQFLLIDIEQIEVFSSLLSIAGLISFSFYWYFSLNQGSLSRYQILYWYHPIIVSVCDAVKDGKVYWVLVRYEIMYRFRTDQYGTDWDDKSCSKFYCFLSHALFSLLFTFQSSWPASAANQSVNVCGGSTIEKAALEDRVPCNGFSFLNYDLHIWMKKQTAIII